MSYEILRNMPNNVVIRCLAFSKDSSKVAATHGNAIHMWNACTGQLVRIFDDRIHGHHHEVNALAFNSQYLASAGEDAIIILWDIRTGNWSRSIDTPHEHPIETLAFSPSDETILVTTSSDQKICKYNIETNALDFHTQPNVDIVQYALDNTVFMSYRHETIIDVWNAEMRDKIVTIQNMYRVVSIACAPNNLYVAVSTFDGVQLCATSHFESITLNAVHLLACVGLRNPNLIRVVQEFGKYELGTRLGTLLPNEHVDSLVFSPDSSSLACCRGNNVYWLTLHSIVPLQYTVETLSFHIDEVLSLDISPDGTMLASGGHDSDLVLWKTPQYIVSANAKEVIYHMLMNDVLNVNEIKLMGAYLFLDERHVDRINSIVEQKRDETESDEEAPRKRQRLRFLPELKF